MSDATADDGFIALHHSLARLVRAYQFRDRDRICCHDVSVTQCYALEFLVESDEHTVGTLAAALFLEKSTTSRAVQGLIDAGYVERSRHPEDGRAVLLRITPAGRRLYRRIDADLLAEERRLFSDLDGDEIALFADGLRRLATAIEARIDHADGACRWHAVPD